MPILTLDEFERPEVLLDRLQAVVAGRPASELDPDDPDREVELVVDDDDRRRVVNRVPAHERDERDTRVVHVGDGDRQRQTAVAGGDGGGPGRRPALGTQHRSVALGDDRDRVGTDIVTGVRVLGSGVAQPDREEVGGRSGPRSSRAPTDERRRQLPAASSVGVSAAGSAGATTSSSGGASTTSTRAA